MAVIPDRSIMEGPAGPTNAQGRAWFLGLFDYLSPLLGSAGTSSAARTALDVYSKTEILDVTGRPDVIDNSNFAVNQRGVTGTVVLASGAYGHDRWKAGTGGCTYTFATSGGITTITISAGSLVQVIEGANLETASYTLSQGGTAQMRVVGGSYAAGPITVSATGGSNLSIEFGTGTVKQVQMTIGLYVTPWVMQSVADDLARCQRFYEVGTIEFSGNVTAASSYYARAYFKADKRSSPTVVLTNGGTPAGFASTVGGTSIITSGFSEARSATGTGTGRFISTFTASADL
jgi:hypothetical protein